MWHCPHCGAPQAESARCWVCRRSSTTCSTCTHFRASLKAEIGWCALDPKRLPLTGLEQRGCWQERTATAAQGAPGPEASSWHSAPAARQSDDSPGWKPPARDFVPVDLVGEVVMVVETASAAGEGEPLPDLAPIPFEREPAWAERTSLFGDLET